TTTPKEVAAIEHWINHYPKRLFNYKSPVEMLKLANFNLKFGFIFLVLAKLKMVLVLFSIQNNTLLSTRT
ncbi:IS30 family transposase, partial [Streptococcus pyogenes]|nr:IS30 family transposase [Streptococcus pyogenes]